MATNDPAGLDVDEPAREPDDDGDRADARLLRALADLDNLRKRCERELSTAAESERARVVAMWLPVVDDLDRALQHAQSLSDPTDFVTGVEAVYEQALDVLARLGYRSYDDIGCPFDPQRHDAVAVVVGANAPPRTIVDAVRRGWAGPAGVLRPAQVVVTKDG